MTDRKVWVVTLPDGLPAGAELMIEQFGDDTPTVATRANPIHTWGPPHPTERR